MDRLIDTYLIYQQLDCGDGLPEVPDLSEDGTASLPFTIEVLDSYCSYFLFFLQLINLNVCYYSNSFGFPILAHSRERLCEWNLNLAWIPWVCSVETALGHIHLNPCLLLAVPSYLSSVKYWCVLQDSLSYAKGDCRYSAIFLWNWLWSTARFLSVQTYKFNSWSPTTHILKFAEASIRRLMVPWALTL